jgi:oligopeptide/dipeptide ABC transporter ATP-binding protein
MNAALLEVADLHTTVTGRAGAVSAVDGASFTVERGEVLGIVGESGSGKSLALLSILGLIAEPVAIASGSIRLEGRELIRLGAREWRRIRGAEISMIFQEPLTSLDAAFTIGSQLVETVRAHTDASRPEATDRAVEMLERVGIASARRRMDAYPHEFSGGMRQRVMIAMALILRPKLLLADEPVTALDVTTQAQILELIAELQRDLGMSVIFVSHDLGVVLDVADRVAVMYAGDLVEVAAADAVFADPAHPYTHGLLVSKLSLAVRTRDVAVMPGTIPPLFDRPRACRFAPRCPNRIDRCVETHPALEPSDRAGRLLRCFNPMRAGREA